jgi:hypothetical protein
MEKTCFVSLNLAEHDKKKFKQENFKSLIPSSWLIMLILHLKKSLIF